MMERETKAFTTPAGNTVVLHTYLTGREVTELISIQFSSVKMQMSDPASKKFDTPNFDGSVVVTKELEEVKKFVVSLNNDTENPVEKLLDLPSTEYDAVLKEVEKIKNPTTPEK
jgi:hypothetical protein